MHPTQNVAATMQKRRRQAASLLPQALRTQHQVIGRQLLLTRLEVREASLRLRELQVRRQCMKLHAELHHLKAYVQALRAQHPAVQKVIQEHQTRHNRLSVRTRGFAAFAQGRRLEAERIRIIRERQVLHIVLAALRSGQVSPATRQLVQRYLAFMRGAAGKRNVYFDPRTTLAVKTAPAAGAKIVSDSKLVTKVDKPKQDQDVIFVRCVQRSNATMAATRREIVGILRLPQFHRSSQGQKDDSKQSSYDAQA